MRDIVELTTRGAITAAIRFMPPEIKDFSPVAVMTPQSQVVLVGYPHHDGTMTGFERGTQYVVAHSPNILAVACVFVVRGFHVSPTNSVAEQYLESSIPEEEFAREFDDAVVIRTESVDGRVDLEGLVIEHDRLRMTGTQGPPVGRIAQRYFPATQQYPDVELASMADKETVFVFRPYPFPPVGQA